MSLNIIVLKLFCKNFMLQALYLNVKKLNHSDMCRQLDRFSKEIRKQVNCVVLT